MKEEDIKTIEDSLALEIPSTLRELLLNTLDNYPDFTFERFSGEKAVETYQNYLADGFQNKRWLYHLLPIGSDETTAQLYFLDLQDSKPWLYSAGLSADPFYDPETYKADCKFGLIL